MTITGFRENGTSLKSLVFGKGQETFNRPVSIAVAPDGKIAIADPGCKCVHLYAASQQEYQKLFTFKDQELVSPVSVIFDDASRLYVSDSVLQKVIVFDRNGKFLFTIDAASRPTGLAYSHEQKLLYVVDTLGNKVYAFNETGETAFSFGGRGAERGQFNYPTHIFRANTGKIYVNDALNFRIQIFDPTGKFLASFGHHGDGSGDFAMPKGVAVDRHNIIYVVDNLFDNIQLFSEQGEFLLTVGDRGSEPDEFWLPSGIFIDDSDKLYVCDTFNQRVQIFRIIEDGHEKN